MFGDKIVNYLTIDPGPANSPAYPQPPPSRSNLVPIPFRGVFVPTSLVENWHLPKPGTSHGVMTYKLGGGTQRWQGWGQTRC